MLQQPPNESCQEGDPDAHIILEVLCNFDEVLVLCRSISITIQPHRVLPRDHSHLFENLPVDDEATIFQVATQIRYLQREEVLLEQKREHLQVPPTARATKRHVAARVWCMSILHRGRIKTLACLGTENDVVRTYFAR